MQKPFDPNVEDPDDLIVLRRSDIEQILKGGGPAIEIADRLDNAALPLMTLPQIQKDMVEDSLRFFPNVDPDNISYLAHAMAEEAGEFNGVLKKMTRGDYDMDVAYPLLVEENVDLFIYCMLTFFALRADPVHAYRIKASKNQERYDSGEWGDHRLRAVPEVIVHEDEVL